MRYKVRQTLQEMLIDRNYHCCTLNDKEDHYVLSYEQSEQTQYVAIFIFEEPKIGIKNVKEMTEKVISFVEPIHHIIIVYANEITTFAKQSLEELVQFRIELFSFLELSFNISKHELVPKHTIDNDSLQLVLQTFKVKKKNLPKIFKNDPIIKYIGAQKGDLIKIHRPNSIYYRVVI